MKKICLINDNAAGDSTLHMALTHRFCLLFLQRHLSQHLGLSMQSIFIIVVLKTHKSASPMLRRY